MMIRDQSGSSMTENMLNYIYCKYSSVLLHVPASVPFRLLDISGAVSSTVGCLLLLLCSWVVQAPIHVVKKHSSYSALFVVNSVLQLVYSISVLSKYIEFGMAL